MNKKILSARWKKNASVVLAMVTLSLLASPAWATNYYVDTAGSDSNDGLSTATPWQTLAHVNLKTYLPGDQILLRRGCAWTGFLHILGNGSSTLPLVVDAYDTGAAPIINGNGAPYAVGIWNKQYTTIQNLEITNDNGTAANRNGIIIGFTTAGTYTGIKILNNDIHNVRAITDTSVNAQSNAAIYILVEGSSVGAHLDSLLIQGNNLYDLRTGGIFQTTPDYYQGNPQFWSTNEIIRDNVIDKTGTDGIVVSGAISPVIEHNAAYDIGVNSDRFASFAGMWAAYRCLDSLFQFNEVAQVRNVAPLSYNSDAQAFDCDLGANGTTIFQYNYTHDNEGGILIMMWENVVKTVIFRYNISVNDNRMSNAGTQLPVNSISGTNSAYVYNNVFYSRLALGFKFLDRAATYYYNNIFDISAATYPSQPVFSNNCYFGHAAEVNDPYRLLADPRFVGPLTSVGGDGFGATTTDIFKLQTDSPCINAGTTNLGPVSNGGRDFYNNPLYSGTYADIGVHEVPGGTNPPPALVTIADDQGAGVSYTGGAAWTHTTDPLYSGGTKSYSSTLGNTVQYTFSGTNVSLFGRKGPAQGKISVVIDGAPAQVVDCYWPVTMYPSELFRASGLSAIGTHTITATIATKNASSTANTISVDYFQVMPSDPGAILRTIAYDLPANGTFSGAWSYTPNDLTLFYGGTRAYSQTVGNTATFTFTGNGVRLYGTKAPTAGKLSISLDGGPATLVNCFQPALNINYEYMAKLYEVTGLSATTHTLVATVATKDPAAIKDANGNWGGVSLDLMEVLTSLDLVKDNTDSTGITITAGTGGWTSSTFSTDYYGANYVHDGNTGKGTKSVRFTPTLPDAGSYQVFVRWSAATGRASNVPIDIITPGGTVTKTVDQRTNGGKWMSLGTYTFNAGTGASVLIRTTGTDGFVIADAVRFYKP